MASDLQDPRPVQILARASPELDCVIRRARFDFPAEESAPKRLIEFLRAQNDNPREEGLLAGSGDGWRPRIEDISKRLRPG